MKNPGRDGTERGAEFVQEAYALFDEFYRATRPYREKCLMNEEIWRTNHWTGQAAREPGEPQPVTPVMFSTLESMLADVMDSYPEAVLLGEEPGDDEVAERLTKLIRYVMKKRSYRSVYREKCRSALIKGAAVQEVYWDGALMNGLGDVNIREWDIVNFLWDPKFADIQDGRAVFTFMHYPRSWYAAHYSHLEPMMENDRYGRERDESYVDESGEGDILMMEYWYKETDGDGATVCHMARIAGGVLLEDSRKTKPEGMYAHGRYPFIVESLYPIAGQPVGLGMVDILNNLQKYADRLDQIILKNALMSGKMKMLINRSADLDEEALIDGDSEVVRGARIDESAVRWMQTAPLDGYVLSYQQSKLAAIKEESGQNMFNRGEAGGGITAASAIVALQEAGSKRSRVLIDQFFDGYETLARMLVDVIQENYTEERVFRIQEEPKKLFRYGDEHVIDFDVTVQVQKQTPYSTLYQNELALQLLGAGVIDPTDALEMMGFEGRERILARRKRMEQTEENPGKEVNENGEEGI